MDTIAIAFGLGIIGTLVLTTMRVIAGPHWSLRLIALMLVGAVWWMVRHA